jgi:hypothetical protein
MILVTLGDTIWAFRATDRRSALRGAGVPAPSRGWGAAQACL